MKKIIFSSLLVALVITGIATAIAGTPISSSSLPQAALTFIAKHYPNDQIRKAEKEIGHRGTEYDVDLSSGTDLEFDSEGNWRKVDAAHGATVPSAIVPKGIAEYVAKNYPNLSIVEIETRRGGYKIELSNDVELMLTAEGTPFQGRRGGKGNYNK